MPQNAASDLDLHCLPITHSGVSQIQWVNVSKSCWIGIYSVDLD